MFSNYLFSEDLNSLKPIAIELSKKGYRNVIRRTPEGLSLEVFCSVDVINKML